MARDTVIGGGPAGLWQRKRRSKAERSTILRRMPPAAGNPADRKGAKLSWRAAGAATRALRIAAGALEPVCAHSDRALRAWAQDSAWTPCGFVRPRVSGGHESSPLLRRGGTGCAPQVSSPVRHRVRMDDTGAALRHARGERTARADATVLAGRGSAQPARRRVDRLIERAASPRAPAPRTADSISGAPFSRPLGGERSRQWLRHLPTEGSKYRQPGESGWTETASKAEGLCIVRPARKASRRRRSRAPRSRARTAAPPHGAGARAPAGTALHGGHMQSRRWTGRQGRASAGIAGQDFTTRAPRVGHQRSCR